MKKAVVLALLAVGLLLFSQSAMAACIRVHVYDSTSKPVNGAAITVDGFPRGVANNNYAEIWYIGSGRHSVSATYLRGFSMYYGTGSIYVPSNPSSYTCYSCDVYAQLRR